MLRRGESFSPFLLPNKENPISRRLLRFKVIVAAGDGEIVIPPLPKRE